MRGIEYIIIYFIVVSGSLLAHAIVEKLKEQELKMKEEVKLANKGTYLYDFQKERTDAISEMFDNQDKHGIYPTSKFFVRLDNKFNQLIYEALNHPRKYTCTNSG